MFSFIAVLILVGALLVLFRAIKGPSIFDRVLSVNLIGTKAVVVIALIGFIHERPEFMDIALTYALINFIGPIAFLKYIEKNKLD
ncbi:MAG: cation:proton antiporter [Kosmotoga sp.]|nr:MAG: cation:proton antiporter [Kosmotoga sp.]